MNATFVKQNNDINSYMKLQLTNIVVLIYVHFFILTIRRRILLILYSVAQYNKPWKWLKHPSLWPQDLSVVINVQNKIL